MKKLFRYLLIFFSCFIIYQTAICQPSNDSYTNSIVLTKLNNWCSRYGQYTNVNSVADTFAGPSCWTDNPSHDVWFKFTAIASSVNIGIYGRSSDGGTLLYPRLVLCTIDSNAVLTYVGTACNEASSSAFPGFTSIYTSELVIGNTYYIRVDGANDNTGSFQLCLQNFTSSVQPGEGCNTAAYLCNKNTITQVALSGWDGNAAEVANSCMDYIVSYTEPANVVWYTFTIAKSGTLTFSIAPNNNLDDIDFGLYHITDGDCSTLKVVRCSASRCYNDSGVVGSTGLNMTSKDTTEGTGCGAYLQDNWVKYLDVNVGESYSLLIDNCSNIQDGTDNGYTLSFGGSCAFSGPIADFKDTIVSSCMGHNSVIFTDKSVGAASYSWNFGESANPAKANTSGPFTVSYSTAGTKTIVLSVIGPGGCEVVKASNVYINYPTPIILKDTSICKAGQTATIYADGFSNYKWSNGSSSNPLIVTPNTTTTYILTATNSSGCSSRGTVVISIISARVIPLNDTSVCAGQTAKVYANGYNSYKWSDGSVSNPLRVNPQSTTTYGLTATNDAGCSFTSNVMVNINPLPNININVMPESKTICFGNSATLTANGASTYLWSPSSGLLTGDTVIAKPSINTTYTVVGTDTNGCKNSATVSVLLILSDPKYTTTSIVGTDPLTVDFTYKGTNNDIKWNFGDKESNDLIGKTASHTYHYDPLNSLDNKTTYTAKMILNYPNCPDTIKINIIVEEPKKVEVKLDSTKYNLVTSNDKFGVKGKGLQSFNLSIFNRWGDKVFEDGNLIPKNVTTNGDNLSSYPLWDGSKTNGSKLSSGTYFYILKITTADSKIQFTRTGTITILR